jgi:hypothetical protein
MKQPKIMNNKNASSREQKYQRPVFGFDKKGVYIFQWKNQWTNILSFSVCSSGTQLLG